jgi:hypothetical protein
MKKKNKLTQASDCECCDQKCKEKSVAFWPVMDPDIPANPYCRKHLDEAKNKVLMAIINMKKLNKSRAYTT